MTTLIDLQGFQVQVVGVLGAIIVAVAIAYKMMLKPMKACKNFFSWVNKFRRDWEGEEADTGRDAVPGVMERLNVLDGELSRNGGKSLKDYVVRLESKLDKLVKRLDGIEDRQKEIQESISPKN
jgi:hypothetical protein